MISKKYRFHGHGSLNYVHRNGKTERSTHMMMKSTPNSRREVSRFAVVVSKKVYKSAVKRNRIRRRVFEIIRLSIKPDSPVFDVVFNIYSPEVIDVPHEKLTKEVQGLLKTIDF
jgi:ribonuclease P protein component, eubacterial